MSNSTKVRRIKADDVADKKATVTKKTQKSVKKAKDIAKTSKNAKQTAKNTPKWLKTLGRPFCTIGRYVKGSIYELKLTKWPNRRATWSLTLAVLIFCAFFVALIMLADWAFDLLVKEIIL